MDSKVIQELSRKEQIVLVNQCRLFMQVENLSDITDAEGKQILSQFINNSPDKPSRSLKKWPSQSDPGREAWTIWKRVLRRAFLKSTGELVKPLGEWTTRNTTRIHEAYWSNKETALIQRNGKDSWSKHNRVLAGRRQNFFDTKASVIQHLPEDAIPVDINVVTEKHIITGRTAVLLAQKSEINDATTLRTKIRHKQHNTLLHNVELQWDEQTIRESLQKPAQFDIASDGGHDQVTGILTYGWVISINETILATGHGPAEAHPYLAESYRAEAYGLASATVFIQTLVKHFGLKVTDH